MVYNFCQINNILNVKYFNTLILIKIYSYNEQRLNKVGIQLYENK